MAPTNYPQGGPGQRLPSPNEKYPFVGNNYMQYGEVPGYVYNPWDDQYYLDKGEYQDYLESTGQIDKAPSISDQIISAAGPALISEGAKAIGAEIPGLFGMGSGAAAGTTAATGGAAAAGTGAAATGAGTAGAAGATTAGTSGAAGTTGSMSAGLMGIAPYAGVAAGLYLGGKGISNYLKGKDSWDPKDDPMGAASRATLGIATGGLSEIARYFGIGRHKSTGQYQKERWGNVAKKSSGWGALADQHKDDKNDVFGPGLHEGEKWSWEAALDRAKTDPKEFAGVLGNAQTFGNDWFGLTNEQRDRVVKRFIDEGLYKSDKGDILISDKNRARQIFDEEKKNTAATPSVPNQPNISKDKPAMTGQAVANMANSPQLKPAGMLGLSSGLSFDPNSAQYKNLSSADKSQYWKLRNQGK